MHLFKRLVLCLGALAFAVFAAGCGGSDSARESSAEGLQALKIGVVSPANSGDYLNYVADEQGFFVEHGIEAEFIPVPQQPIAPLLSGDLDVVTLGLNGLSAIKQGQQVQFVAGLVDPPMVAILAKKGTPAASHPGQWPQAIEDLSGYTLGTSIPAGFNDTMARAIVVNAGAQSVNIVPAGSTPAAIAGLQSGSFDAALLVSPVFEPLLASGDYVATLSLYKNEGPSEVMIPQAAPLVSTKFAEANTELVDSYQQAIQQANDWARDPQNLQALTDLAARKQNVEPGSITETIKTYVSCLAPSINLSEETWNKMLAVSKQAGLITDDYAYGQYVRPVSSS